MKKAIFIRIFTVLIVGLVICSTISAYTLSRNEEKHTEQDMLKMLHIIDESISMEDPNAEAERLAKSAEDIRITVIQLDGTVIGDSHANPWEMENHKDRKEFKEALENEIGLSKRESETLGAYQLYVAFHSDKGVVMRLSSNVDGVLINMLKLMPATLIAILIALVISLIIAAKFSVSLTKPLADIEQELIEVKNAREPVQSNIKYPELSEITTRINLLAKDIKKSAQKLTNEREKLDYIINNMEEGIILIDKKQEVMLINESAKGLLHITGEETRVNIIKLVQNLKLLEACSDAIGKGKSSLFDIAGDDKTVSVHITPVKNEFISEHEAGAVIVLANVTADRTAVQMRQEFFSNASHELKTPITSIYGFAELLEQGLVTDEEKRKEYISRIKQESERITNLINDILMISQLEQKKTEPERKEVDLTETAREIASAIEPQAAQNRISIALSENPVSYYANPQQMRELLCNLMENAVKYNRPGGKVDVTLTQTPTQVMIQVKDNGIGIPLEAQPRIFERFYRVDKGRSKKVGGTGLGLAIVKHIVNNYNGKIELTSAEGIGSRFKIILPVSPR